MSNETNDSSQPSALKRALIAIKDLQAKLEVSQSAQSEPIAIIGTGCRFPGGADSNEAYWQLLISAIDAISEVPANRWDIDQYYDADATAPGKMSCRWGGFLNEIDRFDAKFFGISAREAISMDPQQRLLLEVAWETLENAGLTNEKLAGSLTGVFIGAYQVDYAMRQIAGNVAADIYTGLGNAHSIIANRLSYLLDLKGPSLTVDTACSSSLVAVHLACQSLRNRECYQAISGGVNLIIDPLSTIITTKVVGHSADGKCKTFDSRADGMVRGEGCGVVVLKRLSDAINDGDNILTVIRGSAVNQDGRSTNITAPNGLAQVTVIKKALNNANVDAGQISYIETHGTGTPLGDPIEIEALASVYGNARQSQSTCALGAVKTNIGHLEAASGIAGLIKTVLCFQHQAIPANLHFQKLNPHISLTQTPFTIPTTDQPWPKQSESRYAGVSSFGFGGTNAHLIISDPPQTSSEVAHAVTPDQVYLLPLSARSKSALTVLAQRYQTYLKNNGATESLYDISYTAAIRRSHHNYRLSIAGRTHQELIDGLGSYINSAPTQNVSNGSRERNTRQKVVFIFPGQGSQWLGMGRQLLAKDHVFAQIIAACDQEISTQMGWSLIEALNSDQASQYLEQIDKVQPMLFAIEVALAAMWQSQGVKPDLVIGHSMGEVAACYVAGALTLQDAVTIICRRSRLLKQISGLGSMAAVELSYTEAQKAVTGYEASISLAVSNSPTSTVLSGERNAISQLVEKLERDGIYCRAINVDVASHSPCVDQLRSDLLEQLSAIRPRAAEIKIFSTVTAGIANGAELDADYWVRNLREPVRFAQAIATVAQDNDAIFIEMSPHPILLHSITQTVDHHQYQATTIASLKRDCDENLTVQATRGEIYCAGYQLDWRNRFNTRGKHLPLPNYPWQRERYWIEISPSSGNQISYTQQANIQSENSNSFHDWFYQLNWKTKPRKQQENSRTGKRWLIFADSNGLAQQLVELIDNQQGSAVLVSASESYQKLNDNHYCVDRFNVNDYHRLLSEQHIDFIVYLWGLDTDITEQSSSVALASVQDLICRSALYLIQSVQSSNVTTLPQIWFITEQAQTIDGYTNRPNIASSLLWGMGRVVYLEAPEILGGLLDLDKTDNQTNAQEIFTEIVCQDNESQIAIRDGQRYVARLNSNKQPLRSQTSFSLRPNATYLITGGVGSLGMKVARWMIGNGARHLLLTSRNFPSRSAWSSIEDEKIKTVIAEIKAMEELGAGVEICQVDVSDAESMSAILHQLSFPLRGVVHAAGVSIVQSIDALDYDSFNSVLKPKVAGGWVLHQLTKDLDLDFFLLFSSIASIWGSKGLAHYAAANHFLDSLAHYRQSLGLPTISINWGHWDNIDLAAEFADQARTLFAQIGFHSLPTNEALQALGYLLEHNLQIAQQIIAPVDWQLFKPVFETDKRGMPLFAELADEREQRNVDVDSNGAIKDRIREKVLAVPRAERSSLLQSQIQAIVARALRVSVDQLPTSRPLLEMGIDSIIAVELKKRFEQELGATIAIKTFFMKASIDSLTLEVAQQFDQAGESVQSDDSEITKALPQEVTFTSNSITTNRYSADNWLVFINEDQAAEMRLFCFPYAGGSPAIFRDWPQHLTSSIEVCAIQLPGRGTRITEAPLTDMNQLIDQLTTAILPYLDKPFAFFGHCFGTIVMFEITRRLRSEYGLSPLHLFVSGAAAPHLYLVPDFYKLSREKFIEILQFINFTGTDLLLTDEGLQQLILPALQGDFQIAAQYQHREKTCLDLPITAFAAWEDMFAPPDSVSAWREYTDAQFYLTNYPGGHYFLETEYPTILRSIVAELSKNINEQQSAKLLSTTSAPVEKVLSAKVSTDDETVRLICFPYAGGSSEIYQQWSQFLPANIEVVAIELPGRDSKISENSLISVPQIVAAVTAQLEPYLDQPFACFGHDLGAIIMFEVTRQLRRRGLRLPLRLFVSAAVAPQVYYFAPIHNLPQQKLINAISLFGYPHLAADSIGEHLPYVRSDFQAIATYRYDAEAPLNLPITTIFADADPLIPARGIEAWQAQTIADYNNIVVTGGHYYLRNEAGEQSIKEIISQSLLRERLQVETYHE